MQLQLSRRILKCNNNQYNGSLIIATVTIKSTLKHSIKEQNIKYNSLMFMSPASISYKLPIHNTKNEQQRKRRPHEHQGRVVVFHHAPPTFTSTISIFLLQLPPLAVTVSGNYTLNNKDHDIIHGDLAGI